MNKLISIRIKSSFKIYLLYLLVFTCPVFASDDIHNAAENWYVVNGFNPVTRQQDCFMRSAETVIRLDEDETRLYLLLSGHDLYLVSNSIIDTSYNDSRINVDKYEPISVNQYKDKKTAQIKAFDPNFLVQFIKGYWASVYMGFWPSWEKTGLQEARFDLIGFTRTYTEYIQCQAKSEIVSLTGD